MEERELYDPVKHVDGIVVGPGSGLVTLQLESPTGSPAPLPGDTAEVSIDEMWFDVETPGSIKLTLTDQSLNLVARMEVLETNGNPLLWADSVQRAASRIFAPGRYRLRIQSAISSTATTAIWVWLGSGQPPDNPADLARLSSGTCVGCNLYGADLGGYNLRGANLAGSDMRRALIASVPGGFSLSGGELMAIYIGDIGNATAGGDLTAANLTSALLDSVIVTGADPVVSPARFAGANLSAASMTHTFLSHAKLAGANLTGANLSHSILAQADLRGANLAGAVMQFVDMSGAVLLGANLEGADFSGARLDNAIWSGGQICKPASIGVCR